MGDLGHTRMNIRKQQSRPLDLDYFILHPTDPQHKGHGKMDGARRKRKSPAVRIPQTDGGFYRSQPTTESTGSYSLAYLATKGKNPLTLRQQVTEGVLVPVRKHGWGSVQKP